MLETKAIGYWYTEAADYLYQDVNLTFEKGNMYAILGASGSGKTTFLSLISGLGQPKAGEILYEGKSLSKIGLRNYRKNDVSLIFQAYNLLPYLTALDNVLTAIAISAVKVADKKALALAQLQAVGIDEQLANKQVTQLSGGQQQRVAIARALSCDHELIVADEPTGNLDEKTSQDIVQLFQKVAHEKQKCLIIVTHEREVAKACDKVYELSNKTFQLRQL